MLRRIICNGPPERKEQRCTGQVRKRLLLKAALQLGINRSSSKGLGKKEYVSFLKTGFFLLPDMKGIFDGELTIPSIRNRKEIRMITWCAIGDSFTYLNDHLDETGYRLQKGYLTRILEKLPDYALKLNNIGINGSTFQDWISVSIPKADLYTVLLGTNDWHRPFPMGDRNDLKSRTAGTILGNLGILLDHIRAASPEAVIVAGNPVERADFVYLLNPENNAPGSYQPENGLWLRDLSKELLEAYAAEGVFTVDLWSKSGFTQNRLIHFKRLKRNGIYENLPYPEYIGVPFHPGEDEYPYPEEAIALTYDGLHPSDAGADRIAGLFAEKIREAITK